MKKPFARSYPLLLLAAATALCLPACVHTAAKATPVSSPAPAAAPMPTVKAAPATTVKNALADFHTEIDQLNADAVTDFSSPAGKKLLADVEDTTVQIGLAYATGNQSAIIVDGLEGGAAALNDASGLPTVSSTTLGKAMADGAGVATVANKVTPAVQALIKLASSKTGDSYSVAQAVVQGLQKVRGAVTQVQAIGN